MLDGNEATLADQTGMTPPARTAEILISLAAMLVLTIAVYLVFFDGRAGI